MKKWINTKSTSSMHQSHLQKPLKDYARTNVNLLTKRNIPPPPPLIFVVFPYISLVIINSRYTHCFKYTHHRLFMTSLSGLKHGFDELRKTGMFWNLTSLISFNQGSYFKNGLDSCSNLRSKITQKFSSFVILSP